MPRSTHQGFTLIELAIVLTIIGVLAGGIVMGMSLITTSRLQTILTDVDNYTTAAANFKQQYQALPGDFVNATTQWGTDSNGCPAGGGSSGTCNGNGDGMLTNGNGAGKAGETFQFWQHLKLMGFFSGAASDQAGSGGAYDSNPGVNVPRGSIEGSGISVYWLGSITTGDANYFRDDADAMPQFYGNVFYVGRRVSGASTYGALLTPDQAASLDQKMDDGVPGTGRVRAMISTSALNPNCTTTANSTTSVYNVSNSGVLCSLIFVTGL